MKPLKKNLIPVMPELPPATYWDCSNSSGCCRIIQRGFGLWQQMRTGGSPQSPCSITSPIEPACPTSGSTGEVPPQVSVSTVMRQVILFPTVLQG